MSSNTGQLTLIEMQDHCRELTRTRSPHVKVIGYNVCPNGRSSRHDIAPPRI